MFRAATPGIKLIPQDNISLLGAPIHKNATSAILGKKLDELKLMSKRLLDLDAHDALFLLKNCFFIPKLLYLFRTSPCFSNRILEEFDNTIRNTLQSILNVNIDDSKWTQSSLPVGLGGLGVRSATELPYLPSYLQRSHVCLLRKQCFLKYLP